MHRKYIENTQKIYRKYTETPPNPPKSAPVTPPNPTVPGVILSYPLPCLGDAQVGKFKKNQEKSGKKPQPAAASARINGRQ